VKRTDWTYLAQLARAMQQECVDGRIAGDFIAEVDAHLAESGADPVEEFGPPAALAREVAARDGAVRKWSLRTPWWGIAAGLLLMLVLVVVTGGVLDGWPERFDVTAGPLAYALTIYTLGVGFGFVATRRLDGRSWAALTGWKSWVAVLAIAILGTTLATTLAEQVIFTISRSAVIALGVVVVPLAGFIVFRTYNPIRFPAHAPHLKPLRRGLLADLGRRPGRRPAEGTPGDSPAGPAVG
jgi:hypothetical protein